MESSYFAKERQRVKLCPERLSIQSLLSILLPDLLYKGMLLGVGDQPALIEEIPFLSSQLRNLAPRY